jgi:outer membrane lipoprotein-sorting protein
MLARRFAWASLLALLGALAVPHLAGAAEFSAEVVMSGTGISATGTLYVKGKNSRMEMQRGDRKLIMIVNADKKMLWSIDAAAKTYWGGPVAAEVIAANAEQLRGNLPPKMRKEAKTRRLGTETVSGYPCEKTETQTKDFTMTTWYSKKLDIALRLETKTTRGQQYHQEMKNIKVRKLPDSLFVVPAGYKEGKPNPSAAGRAGPGGRRGPSAPRPPAKP